MHEKRKQNPGNPQFQNREKIVTYNNKIYQTELNDKTNKHRKRIVVFYNHYVEVIKRTQCQ